MRHDRYWTVELAELYLRRCESLRLEDPGGAWKMIRHGAELVQLIRIGSNEGELSSRAEKASLATRTRALEGEIGGLAGHPQAARFAFEEAMRISLAEKIQVAAAAELQRRLSAYAMRRGALDEARRRLEQSIELFRRLESDLGLGEALLLSGYLRWPGRGLVGLAEALACTRPKGPLAEHLFDASLALLMFRLQEPRVTFEEYEAILGWLYLARKRWFSRRSKTLRKLGVQWAEGRALTCLGLGRLAQRRLTRAWEGLAQLDAGKAMAVASLDLAYVQIGHDERPSAREVLRETCRRIESGDENAKVGDLTVTGILVLAEKATLTELLELRRELGTALLPRAEIYYPLSLGGDDGPSST